MTRRRSPGAAWWCTLAVLSGCAGVPEAPPSAPPPAPAEDRAAPAPAPRPATGIAAFERRQVERATQAAAQGRLADAALAWEALALLRPDEPKYRDRLAETRARIDAGVAQRLPAGQAALRRGDLDAASDAFFDVLALQPTHRQAADGLREVERERNRRRVATRFSRPLLASRNGAAGPRAAAPADGGQAMARGDAAPGAGPAAASARRLAPSAVAAAPAVRNQLEHAALLAGAGDVDGAIGVLAPEQAARPSDPALRSTLADLYVRRAERLQTQDRAAALDALAAALRLEPAHAAARQLQQQLRRAR